jgi:OPA family glycerol-3-phosphate transporter-like MFS transporter
MKEKEISVNTITNPRKAFSLCLACGLVYALSYMGRLNYSAALPCLLADGILTKPQGGLISTAYFFAYGFGQLINGALTDRSQPEKRVLLGCAGIAVLNFAVPFASSFPVLLILWLCNGFFQSMLWAPCYSLIVTSLRGMKNLFHYVLALNMSSALGAIFSYLISALLLSRFSWKSLFYVPAVLLAGGAAVFQALTFYAKENVSVKTISQKDDMIGAGKKRSSFSLLSLLSVSGMLLLIPAVMIHGMLKDGTTTWGPTMMSEQFHLSDQTAVIYSVIPQIANLIAATLAFWLTSRFRNEIRSAIFLFGVAVLGLAGMLTVGLHNSVCMISLLALVIVSMQAANVVFVSQVPLHFEKHGYLATLTGLFDAMAYLGCAVSIYLVALISDGFGWNATVVFWLISAFAGLVICFFVCPQWKHFLKGKDLYDK